MLAAPRQLVKLVVQDLALVQATWPARYQPGVSPVIYNFVREIMGLKNHRPATDSSPSRYRIKNVSWTAVRSSQVSKEVGQEEGRALTSQ